MTFVHIGSHGAVVVAFTFLGIKECLHVPDGPDLWT